MHHFLTCEYGAIVDAKFGTTPKNLRDLLSSSVGPINRVQNMLVSLFLELTR